ncbi:MAG: hypothetical protein ACLUDU_05025 [Butyricimonas faecihominis]
MTLMANYDAVHDYCMMRLSFLLGDSARDSGHDSWKIAAGIGR